MSTPYVEIVRQGNMIRNLFSPWRLTEADFRDLRDPSRLGDALLALRRRSPKAPLATLYDRHADRLWRVE